MSAQQTPKLKPKVSRPALEPSSGPLLKTYALIRAVYMDELERAKAILAAEPDQINRPDPFAGLTPLHIAIFRQNVDIVRLLAGHPECKAAIKDNFGRLPLDMLAYTPDREIFELVTRIAMSEIERAWHDHTFDDGRAAGSVVPFQPKRKDDDS